MMSWRRYNFTASIAVLACVASFPQPALAKGSTLDALLARPLSPGTVALLLEHAQHDPRAVERIRAAFASENPEVRAAAARVVHVSGLGPLKGTLVEALSKETDPAAAVEELAALVVHDPSSDDAALEAAHRLGEGTAGWLAHALIALGRPSAAAQMALRRRDAVLWIEALASARAKHVPVQPDLLAAALADPTLRFASLNHLAVSEEKLTPRPAVVTEALTRLRETEASADKPFALELLDRQDGRPPEDRGETWDARGRRGALFLLEQRRELEALLTAAERKALLPEIAASDKWKDKSKDKPLGESSLRKPSEDEVPILRLATGYPPSYVRDTLHVSGCAAPADWLLAGRVSYGAQWLPTAIGVFEVPGKECTTAARALVASHVYLDFDDTVPNSRATLVIPLYPEAQECSTVAFLDAPGTAVVSAAPLASPPAVFPLKRLRDREVRYPREARNAGLQGAVKIEVTISPTGCVRRARVTAGEHEILNLEALRSVAGWQYAPRRLDGVPVSAIMTVTSTFKLGPQPASRASR